MGSNFSADTEVNCWSCVHHVLDVIEGTPVIAAQKDARRSKEHMRTIMSGKYSIDMSKAGFLGRGSFCTCHKGMVVETGELVAIKVYKSSQPDFCKVTALMKHERCVSVLQKLQEPFEQPADTKLWNSQMDALKPARLFMRLLDHSKDMNGEPGYDTDDGKLYVVTELAQQSLQDYLSKRRLAYAPPSKETVRSFTKAIIMVMAGLHAKGFVHLDMKPENLMIFDGRLKLIDVDGCVEIGTSISLDDESISFSPCYCSPEWASFVVQNGEEDYEISAAPDLDVWSVGCTICELVTLEAIMRKNCNKLTSKHGSKGKLKFMTWLGGLKCSPVPAAVQEFDAELLQLMTKCLLVCPQSERLTCAEALDSPYLAGHELQRRKSSPLMIQAYEEEEEEPEAEPGANM